MSFYEWEGECSFCGDRTKVAQCSTEQLAICYGCAEDALAELNGADVIAVEYEDLESQEDV